MRQIVRNRAGDQCEYCQLTQEQSPLTSLQIEHILPLKHGGKTELDNLALACMACNLHKGSDIAGIDPQTNQLTPLFNPRTQNWSEHFVWSGVEIQGLTSTGRTTVTILKMNSEERIRIRLAAR
ncbi:MAG: HNH endonuclease signature motif containing protein [Planctomycetales bacterium]